MLYSTEVVYQLYIENNRPHWRQTDDINVLVSNISESLRWHSSFMRKLFLTNLVMQCFIVFVKLNETV